MLNKPRLTKVMLLPRLPMTNHTRKAPNPEVLVPTTSTLRNSPIKIAGTRPTLPISSTKVAARAHHIMGVACHLNLNRVMPLALGALRAIKDWDPQYLGALLGVSLVIKWVAVSLGPRGVQY